MAARTDRGLALIAYRCSVQSHGRSQPREFSTLTYHVDGWAYCPRPGSRGHRWAATGGVPLRGLLTRGAGRLRR